MSKIRNHKECKQILKDLEEKYGKNFRDIEISCACGCGTKIKKFVFDGKRTIPRERKFVHGHSGGDVKKGNTFWKFRKNKTNSLKEKTYEEIHGKEEATRLRKCRQTESLGIKRTDATREKLRVVAKNRTTSSFKGHHHTLEFREWSSQYKRKNFGNRAEINKQIRKYYKVREWTKNIFERDDYICKNCGIRNKKGLGKSVKLEAHHIVLISEIIGERCFDEAILLPELYDLENGITLCRRCHKLAHGWDITE